MGAPLEKPEDDKQDADSELPWMRAFGGLRDLRDETRRIELIIEEEFETIDEEDW